MFYHHILHSQLILFIDFNFFDNIISNLNNFPFKKKKKKKKKRSLLLKILISVIKLEDKRSIRKKKN